MRTITKAEFVSAQRHGYAGVSQLLMPETIEGWRQNPEWDGDYWAMWLDGGKGTVLGPVNMTEA